MPPKLQASEFQVQESNKKWPNGEIHSDSLVVTYREEKIGAVKTWADVFLFGLVQDGWAVTVSDLYGQDGLGALPGWAAPDTAAP